MNIVRAALRLSSIRSILNPVRQNVVASPKNASTNLSTRPLWLMCSSSSGNNQMLTTKSRSLTFSSSKYDQDVTLEAERELLDYLNNEISTRKNQPKELDGFKIEAKGSVLELYEELGNDERVKIYLNVNGIVDPVKHPPQDEDDKKCSNPTFKIELIKGDQKLDLTCSFIYSIDDCRYDSFQIDEFTLYEGERKMETYAISITPDTYFMHDLLIFMLDDMGICDEFARDLYDLAIEHERNQYLGLLERMHKFFSTPNTIPTSAIGSIVDNGVAK